MSSPGPIVVAMVVQNDEDTIKDSVESFYPDVDKIFISNDPTHGWSGIPIVPDATLDILHTLDVDRKIEVISRNFHNGPDPLANDTAQRQYTVDYVNQKMPGLKWILQIDADEQFLDFPFLLNYMNDLPATAQALHWRWIPIFNRLEDGRFLVVSDANGEPQLESFPVAHKPGAQLRVCRYIHPDYTRSIAAKISRRFTGKDPVLEFQYPESYGASKAALHFTFAKSEKRIREKLHGWSHTAEMDPVAFFELWKKTKTDWSNLRDFHPLTGSTWPRLMPFSLEELLAKASAVVPPISR